ncbi:MAG: cytochrome P450 [Myxococcales bacterium]|nr:cytochrome P450 [Myxococcales bacterium]
MAIDPATDPWKGFNLFENRREIHQDLYPIINRIRDTAPVWKTPIGIWIVSRYDDVERLLKHTAAGVRTRAGVLPSMRPRPPDHPRDVFMLSNDPPVHTRLRRLVQQAFTPRALQGIAATVERVVAECLDAIADRDEVDLVEALALPVPSIVICEMMGVPQEDRARFTRWTAEATHDLQLLPPPELAARADAASFALAAYFRDLIARRRDDLRDDILSGLIRAAQDGGLTEPELVSQAIGLLIAGFETTIGGIALGVRTLLRHPDQLARLRAEPALIKPAVEECLRYDTSIPMTLRLLHEEAEFGGERLPVDTAVVGLIAAAQRDPAAYPDPDTFDITRDGRPILAFGGGIHHCLGAHLARMEMQTAILALVQRFDDLQLVGDELELGRSLFRVPERMLLRRG